MTVYGKTILNYGLCVSAVFCEAAALMSLCQSVYKLANDYFKTEEKFQRYNSKGNTLQKILVKPFTVFYLMRAPDPADSAGILAQQSLAYLGLGMFLLESSTRMFGAPPFASLVCRICCAKIL